MLLTSQAAFGSPGFGLGTKICRAERFVAFVVLRPACRFKSVQRCGKPPRRPVQLSSRLARFPSIVETRNAAMSARSTISALAHSRQANQLREQLQGLLPDGAKPAAEAVQQEAGAGLRMLLDYATLAAEYGQPIVSLVQRLAGRASAEAVPAARAAQAALTTPRRRSAWRTAATVGLVLGIAALAYGYGSSKAAQRTARSTARNA